MPAPVLPDNPGLSSYVVTPGGQKLLLDYTEVTVSFDSESKSLVSSHPGWWIVNYPLDRIENLPADFFGKPASEIKNWYLRTPGTPGAEPTAPSGPAPFKASKATHTVDPSTIAKTLAEAKPGDVIQVQPGVYRESLVASNPGTPDKPIILEGLRDKDGNLPRFSGNTPAPKNAWTKVGKDLWRAENWTSFASPLTLNNTLIRERTLLSELGENEFLHNFAHPELVSPPKPDLKSAVIKKTDKEGFLDLGETRGLFYLTSWVWLEPGKSKEVWNPKFPEPLTGELRLDGPFRASRQAGTPLKHQLNLYRFWLNDELLPAYGLADEPRARTGYGRDGDTWMRAPFQEGWNKVTLLIDSTKRRKDTPHRLRLGLPSGRPDSPSQATKPGDLSKAGPSAPSKYLSEWSVIGPIKIEKTYEEAIYFRSAPGVDPNTLAIEMGARESVLKLNAPHWTVRGLEFSHGTQYQQRSLVTASAPGVVIEHCFFKETEVRPLSVTLHAFDQHDPPVIIRGNWFRDPGSLGIGASGSTEKLSADNLNLDQNIPSRGRFLIEHNTIINNNRSGYKRMWESGAMKFFRLTGCIIRHNTILGGDGPGIWLDWEHYQNRIEGNYIEGTRSLAVGVEASPGPILVANNVIHNIREGGAWFRYGILAWSSSRMWTIGNTIVSPNGAMFAEGNDDRGTPWGALPERNAAFYNNLVVGKTTLHRGRLGWVDGNRLYGPEKSGIHIYSRWTEPELGKVVEASPQMAGSEYPVFKNPEKYDYRTTSAMDTGVTKAPVTSQGKEIDLIPLNHHDFHGLLRFPEDPTPTGAYRVPPSEKNKNLVEIEWKNGKMQRVKN